MTGFHLSCRSVPHRPSYPSSYGPAVRRRRDFQLHSPKSFCITSMYIAPSIMYGSWALLFHFWVKNFLNLNFKLGDKERCDKEQIDGNHFLWPICQFTVKFGDKEQFDK